MTQRKNLMAGNWKLNTDRDSARALARDIAAGLPADLDVDVVLFPPALFVSDVVETVSGASQPIGVGVQDVYFVESGAFTGQISASMVRSTGAGWVILGHSERRHVFGETDEEVGLKMRAALDAGLTPILCVGETIEERDSGQTEAVVLRQLRAGLERVKAEEISLTVIAYEPVWAIGTGKTATPAQGEEVHATLRKDIADRAGKALASGIRILYGGSVKPGNVKDLLSEPDIDGALVGGASLKAEDFLAISTA